MSQLCHVCGPNPREAPTLLCAPCTLGDRAAARGPLIVPGRRVWRVYFNSHAAAPLVWCIAPATVGDEVGYEIAVADVVIHGASTAVYRGGDAQPKAWMEAVGYLEIDSAGVASILRQPRSE